MCLRVEEKKWNAHKSKIQDSEGDEIDIQTDKPFVFDSLGLFFFYSGGPALQSRELIIGLLEGRYFYDLLTSLTRKNNLQDGGE